MIREGSLPAVYRLAPFTLSILLILLYFQPCTAQETPIPQARPSLQAPQHPLLAEKIQVIVENHLGVRYQRGGSSKKGVDCSGFVRLVWRNVYGIDLPYIAARQFSMPIFRDITPEDLKTGDLIFFSPTTRKKRINHVGIYLANGRFAHAIERKGVTISSLQNRYWKTRIFSTKRMD